jgi:copper chaperone NosL
MMTVTAGRRLRRTIGVALLAPLALLACEIGPEPVHTDSDECAHCSMLITDRRFAAQLLNAKGRSYKFDSIECLRGFVQAGVVPEADVHSTWVTDSRSAGEWVRSDEAVFLQSPGVHSPMGAGLVAFAGAAAAASAQAELDGELLTWAELLAKGDTHAH